MWDHGHFQVTWHAFRIFYLTMWSAPCWDDGSCFCIPHLRMWDESGGGRQTQISKPQIVAGTGR